MVVVGTLAADGAVAAVDTAAVDGTEVAVDTVVVECIPVEAERTSAVAWPTAVAVVITINLANCKERKISFTGENGENRVLPRGWHVVFSALNFGPCTLPLRL